ncbi:DNA-binding transcriptional LysR family regulator [Bosea sp. BE271]|jgi:DNA-binding transcriptional LysR family regulator|uniref:LysR family transcriptional regulator n=1 Tax=Bosea TaxID=85413 RepID=UPI00285D7CF6|nr:MULTISPECIES: LysR family transcriptional regulator [Bosea]MDR6830772.1 DNA-binding transcriptional LysR family regulator [Bosea robiniae]MDR6895429.1 DNA-binding transcriptional LysR family regulator [Bosea sp. BE109]MDR7138825.1 DNA-binding transcriptional LysR family regulator [Bosea sp. BE168]MDR7175526.1 DNA-binding transcriptional LysR family regulator [Bosea sp. BE271]
MKDRFAAMQIFLAVVEEGSLSAAARQLGVPLTTVSRTLSDLEQGLGARLLTRTTRRSGPTEAGSRYVAACRRILESVEEAEREVTGEYVAPKGELVLTAPIVFGRLHLLPVVTQFLARFPDIDIRLVLSDRYVDLVGDHVDVALRIGDLPDSELIARPVGEIRPVCCASPAYLTERGHPEHPDDLLGHDCVGFDGALPGREWPFLIDGERRSVATRPRLVVNTAEAAIDAAIAGVGITRVLSYQIAEAVRSGRLECVLHAFALPPSPVQLVHAMRGLAPQKLKVFMDFAAPQLRTRLAAVG